MPLQKPEIAREADFANREEEFRVVRLSQSHKGYSFTEILVAFQSTYRITFHRVEAGVDGHLEKFDMSINDFNNMCEAWSQYKKDWEAYNGRMFPVDFEREKQKILDQ